MSYGRSDTQAPAVGDTVVFDYGGGLMVTGTVVEDRGEIGVEGRRLLRVCVEMEPGVEPMFIELPVGELSVTQRVA